MKNMTENTGRAVEHCFPIRELLSVPKSDKQCDRMTDFLNNLLDEVGNNEKHHLSSLIETLTALIEDYERKTIPEPKITPAETLQFLMEENSLTPRDLKQLGTERDIAERLNGTKAFDMEQIKYLCH